MSISIVTVALNGARHIRNAIESVLAQDHRDLQYIVIDGRSTDDTVAIVESYRQAFGNRLTVVSERDAGLYDAMNKGIGLATGDVIGILNSDDRYLSGALAAVEKAFRSEPADIVYGDTVTVYSEDEAVVHKAETSSLRDHMSVGHPACFVRRTAYERWGVFDTKYSLAADYDFILRCYLAGARFAHVDRVLARFEYGGASAHALERSRREVFEIQSRRLGRAHAIRRRARFTAGVWFSAARRTVGSAVLGRERFERIAKRWRQRRGDS